MSVREWPWWRLYVKVAPLLNVHRTEDQLKARTVRIFSCFYTYIYIPTSSRCTFLVLSPPTYVFFLFFRLFVWLFFFDFHRRFNESAGTKDTFTIVPLCDGNQIPQQSRKTMIIVRRYVRSLPAPTEEIIRRWEFGSAPLFHAWKFF